MKGSKAKKSRCLIRAARITVGIIEKSGLKCTLVGFIGAFLHGSKPVPEDVSVAILQTQLRESTTTVAVVSELLQNADPTHFRMTAGPRQSTRDLRYYDSASDDSEIGDNNNNFCRIRLTVISDPAHIYNHCDVIQLRNLPVMPLLPILIDHLRDLLLINDRRDQATTRNASGWPPSASQFRHVQNLLELTSSKVVNLTTLSATTSPPLSAFNHEATVILERSSCALPRFSIFLRPLIDALRSSNFTSELPSLITDKRSLSTGLNNLNMGGVGSDLDNDIDSIDPRTRTIYIIAKKVVKILGDLDIECVLFGSAACSLYGNTRSPNDIDLLVFPPPWMSREQIKEVIVTTSSEKENESENEGSFHLERSATSELLYKPEASYKILYYRFHSIKNHNQRGPRGFFRGNKCKVDILVPGILHLPPKIPKRQITTFCGGGLPVVPFSLLLLQKLQAWDDHMQLRWTDHKKYGKAVVDAMDLQNLLSLDRHVASLKVSRPPLPWDDPVLFSQEFQVLSRRRVRDFCDRFPEFRNDFVSLRLLLPTTY